MDVCILVILQSTKVFRCICHFAVTVSSCLPHCLWRNFCFRAGLLMLGSKGFAIFAGLSQTASLTPFSLRVMGDQLLIEPTSTWWQQWIRKWGTAVSEFIHLSCTASGMVARTGPLELLNQLHFIKQSSRGRSEHHLLKQSVWVVTCWSDSDETT